MLSIIEKPEARPTGRLHLEVFRRGELVEVFDEDNIVVDGYKQIHAHLIGGDTGTFRLTQFGVGTSGTAPAVGNSALSDQFIKAVDAATYPVAGQVKFDFSLNSGEANGKSIMEFGLLTAGGALYARRVRSSALLKTADISFVGTWVITF